MYMSYIEDLGILQVAFDPKLIGEVNLLKQLSIHPDEPILFIVMFSKKALQKKSKLLKLNSIDIEVLKFYQQGKSTDTNNNGGFVFKMNQSSYFLSTTMRNLFEKYRLKFFENTANLSSGSSH